MEKEKRSKSQTHKNHPDPEDGTDGIEAADHDELAHIPGGKGKDKAGEELMGDVLRLAGKHDQTKGEVHGKGKSGGKG